MDYKTIATGVYYYNYDGQTLIVADDPSKLVKVESKTSPVVRYSEEEWQHVTFFQMEKNTVGWDNYLTNSAIKIVDKIISELPKDELSHSYHWQERDNGAVYKLWVPKRYSKVAVENVLRRSGIHGQVR